MKRLTAAFISFVVLSIICTSAHASLIIRPKNIEAAVNKSDQIVEVVCKNRRVVKSGPMAFNEYEFEIVDVLKGGKWKKGDIVTKRLLWGAMRGDRVVAPSVIHPIVCTHEGEKLILVLEKARTPKGVAKGAKDEKKMGNISGVDYGLMRIVETQGGPMVTNKYMKENMFKGLKADTPGAKAVKKAGIEPDKGVSAVKLDEFKNIIKSFVGDGGS